MPWRTWPSSLHRFSARLLPNTLLVHGAPIITSITGVSNQQIQTIMISGSGFGTASAYSGDSGSIAFFDLDHNAPDGWSGGFVGTFPGGFLAGVPNPVGVDDAVGLIIDSWTDSTIVLGGFSGAYGSNGWILNNGDDVELFVWNAQTGSGPATISTVVGSSSSAQNRDRSC